MTTPLDPVAARPDALIVAIANQKGGVGKSTTTINLGGALALQGERILLVDLDPQGNTSSGLGIDRRAIDVSTYEVLVDGVPIEDVVEPTSVRDLFVIPATIELARPRRSRWCRCFRVKSACRWRSTPSPPTSMSS